MNTIEFTNILTKNYGDFGTYLIGNELRTFGDLPKIPKDYCLYKVNNEKELLSVKKIMEILNSEIDTLYPNHESTISFELDGYEEKCFLTNLLFTEIYDYWCGKNTSCKFQFDDIKTIANFDSLNMEVWSWIKNEITTEELKRSVLKFKDVVRGV